MYSNFSLKQDYVALCHYIYKEFKVSISTVWVYCLFSIAWFHQCDCGGDDDDRDDDNDNNNNYNNIIIKFTSIKVQMSLCMP